MAEEDLQESAERAFQAYGRTLEMVTSFKYLGPVLTGEEDDWTAVVGNLRKARNFWARLARILVLEGASSRVSGMFSRQWYRRCCYLG